MQLAGSVDLRSANTSRPTHGAYGLRLANVERARPLLVAAPESWIDVRITSRIGRAGPGAEHVSEEDALLKLRSGGAIIADREAGEAAFVLPRPVEASELVHPLLAPIGAVFAHWAGRESFHAGAIVCAGKAWGVVGPRGAGKSTTMARLALDGADVFCDDLLVVEEGRALAGPRSVDLRKQAASTLGTGDPLGVVGARERWRLTLAPVAPSVELAGWIFLAWGEQVECVPVQARERVRRLQAERGIRVPPRDPAALLDLASLPTWELRRPRRFDRLAEAAARLLETVT